MQPMGGGLTLGGALGQGVGGFAKPLGGCPACTRPFGGCSCPCGGGGGGNFCPGLNLICPIPAVAYLFDLGSGFPQPTYPQINLGFPFALAGGYAGPDPDPCSWIGHESGTQSILTYYPQNNGFPGPTPLGSPALFVLSFQAFGSSGLQSQLSYALPASQWSCNGPNTMIYDPWFNVGPQPPLGVNFPPLVNVFAYNP